MTPRMLGVFVEDVGEGGRYPEGIRETRLESMDDFMSCTIEMEAGGGRCHNFYFEGLNMRDVAISKKL